MNPFSAAARASGAAVLLLTLSGCYYPAGYYPYGYSGAYGAYPAYPPVPAVATQRETSPAQVGAPDDSADAAAYGLAGQGAAAQPQTAQAPPPGAYGAVPAPAPVYGAPAYQAYPAYYPPYPAYPYPAYPAYYGGPGWWGPSVSLNFGYWGGGGGWHGHHH